MSGAVLTLMGATGGGGDSAVTITVNPTNIFGIDFSPAPSASAEFTLDANGTAFETVNGLTPSPLFDWCVPAAQAPNYEVYATLLSGSVSGDAVNAWLALSSTRSWEVSTPGSPVTGTLNVGIRRAGTTTILSSADVFLYAELI
jgi:hypothetical protein